MINPGADFRLVHPLCLHVENREREREQTFTQGCMEEKLIAAQAARVCVGKFARFPENSIDTCIRCSCCSTIMQYNLIHNAFWGKRGLCSALLFVCVRQIHQLDLFLLSVAARRASYLLSELPAALLFLYTIYNNIIIIGFFLLAKKFQILLCIACMKIAALPQQQIRLE